MTWRSIGAATGRPTMLVVGAASRDLRPADPRGWRLGGGVTYGAMAVARLGVEVRALIGADEQAAGAHELDLLRAAGVDVHVARLDRGPVFDNLQLPGGRREQLASQASDPIPAAALPARWRQADGVVLAPVAGELGPEWSSVFEPRTLVALGWQGMLRQVLAGRSVQPLPVAPSPLSARADLSVISAEDARAGGAPLEALLPRAGQRMVISNGAAPAVLVARRSDGLAISTLPVTPSPAVRDETGAGDVLLATWAAGECALRARGQSRPGACLALALGAASASVEVSRVEDLIGLPELCRRLLKPPIDRPPAG
jgi:sugar/nucleoside kinase (ribokinase family)